MLDVTGNELLQRCKKCTHYCCHFSVALLWEMGPLYVSQNIHLLSKSLHQVNVLETVFFLFTVTLFTPIVNHTLLEYLCKKSYEFYPSSDNNYITKKCHFPRMMFLSNFLFFFYKKITLESRNTIFPLISVVHQIRAAL